MNPDSLGVRLRKARKTLGLSQDGMAASCGVSREMWGKYERDVALPGFEVLASLARGGVDLRYVLTGEVPSFAPIALSEDERLLLHYYREAEPAVRKAALGALLGVSDRGAHIGGTFSQHATGDGSIQIGRVKKAKG